MKKLMSMLVMILMLVTTCAMAEEGQQLFQYNDYQYILLEDGTAEICFYTGSQTRIDVPSKVDGYKVTAFGTNGNKYLESVKLPNTITTITDSAFYGSQLTSITIPNSVTTIGDYAFAQCTSLTEVKIPDSVTQIGDNAFWGCTALTDIPALGSVDSIGHQWFSGCTGLVDITIPDGIAYIGDWAFADCVALKSVTLPDSFVSLIGSPFSRCSEELVFLGSPKLFASGKRIAAYTICAILNDDTIALMNYGSWTDYTSAGNNIGLENELIIPAEICGRRVSTIGSGAFQMYDALTSVIIPEGIKVIDSSAFRGCNKLVSVEVPDSVEIIGGWAFSECSSLEEVKMGKKVKSIGFDAFKNCSPDLTIRVLRNSYAEAYCKIYAPQYGFSYVNYK